MLKRRRLSKKETREFIKTLSSDFYFGIEDQKEEIKHNNKFWNRVFGNYKPLTPISPNWSKIRNCHPNLIFTI